MKGLLTDDIEVEQLLLNFKILKTIQLGPSYLTTNYNLKSKTKHENTEH